MSSRIYPIIIAALLSLNFACSPQHSGSDDPLTEADIQTTTPMGTTYQPTHEEPSDCICPEVYDPVCGSDERTYGNACLAECRGVEVASTGACSTQEATY